MKQLALTECTFMKVDISVFFVNLATKLQVSLKSGKNNRYFTYIYDHISLSFSRMRNISDTVYTENQNTHFIFYNSFFFFENRAVYMT